MKSSSSIFKSDIVHRYLVSCKYALFKSHGVSSFVILAFMPISLFLPVSSSKRLNVNPYKLSESEGMLRAVGSQHSLVWLFAPYWGVFISNAGSSLNEIPLFVFDKSCERAIKVASERYEAFLAGLMSKARECEEDIVLEAERWETENGGRKETWKPRGIDDMVTLEADAKWKRGMLPDGWESVPSRSRPGEISYYHRPSGQSQRRHPLDPHYLKQQRKLKAEKSFMTVARRRLMSKFTSSRSPRGGRNARGDDATVATSASSVTTRSRAGPSSSPPVSLPRSPRGGRNARGDGATVATSASSGTTRSRTLSSPPPGWIRTPSRSRPDVTVFLHVDTGAQSPNLPTVATQQALIRQWKLENPKEARREVARGDIGRAMPPAQRHHRGNEEALQRDDTTFARSTNGSTRRARNGFASSRRSRGGHNARGDGATVATSTSSVTTRPQTGSSAPPPPGWVHTPSRSNPGVTVYLHVKTGARSLKFPTAEREREVLEHWKNEYIRIYGVDPFDNNVRPVESTVQSAEGGRRLSAESTQRDATTVLSSSNNTIKSSRTVVTFGDTVVLNEGGFDNGPPHETQDTQSERTPISDWLNTVGKQYGVKFGPPFAERNVETLEQMLALDDHDFIILRKRVKAFIAVPSRRNHMRAQKQQTKLLAAMGKAFHRHLSSSSSSSSDDDFYPDDWHDDDSDVESVILGGAPAAVETDEALEDQRKDPHRHRARDVVRVRSALKRKSKRRSVAASIDRGIYTLHFDATTSSYTQPSADIGVYFHEHELFWRIEVPRPTNASPCFGEGMLIWFDSSSAIGTVDLGKNDNSASVKFVEAPASRFKGYTHGQQIDALTAYQTYEINPLVRFAQYGSNYSGRPDQNLPSKSSPLFVPKSAADTFVCTMCLHWPRQSKPPVFTLRACYIPETPISGLEKDSTRKLKWTVHFAMLLATVVVVLTGGESQIGAIGSFLVASMVAAMIGASEFYVSVPLTVLPSSYTTALSY